MDYNSKNGLMESLQTLESFNEMLDARHRAYYIHKIQLNEFIVFGRYFLDTCGNCMTATKEFIPAEHINDIPMVSRRDEFWRLMEAYDKEKHPNVLTIAEIKADDFNWENNKRPFPTSISWGMGNDIPPAIVKCPECDEKWNINNCWDVIRNTETITFDLSDYVGTMFAGFKNTLKEKTDAHYFIIENKIYNENNDSAKKRMKVAGSCIIQKGDYCLLSKWIYKHKSCFVKASEDKCKKFLSNNGDGYSMGNLAGRIDCDAFIKLELELAGIDILEHNSRGEVPYKHIGCLGNGSFTFKRAWTYWMVSGDVPMDIANELYANPIGKETIRVNGHCGCPSPSKGTWKTDDCKEIIFEEELDELSPEIRKHFINNEKYKVVKKDDVNIDSGFGQYITSYHIDCWEGLKIFADKIKRITGKVNHRPEIMKRLRNVND